MDTLPVEVLLNIFERVWSDSACGQRNMFQIVQVCRRWHQAGCSILRRNVRLHHDNIHSFVTNSNSESACWIQSLKLAPAQSTSKQDFKSHARPLRRTYRPRTLPHLDRFWHRLGVFVNQLDRLSSLSLYIPRRWEDFVGSYFNLFNGPRICALISHLPASIRNLDIDVESLDKRSDQLWVQGWPDHDICSSIASIAPRLENLRLGLQTICPSLITEALSMQSIVIYLRSRAAWNVCDCGKEAAALLTSTAASSSEKPDTYGIFVTEVRQKLQNNPSMMPNLSHFVLISTFSHGTVGYDYRGVVHHGHFFIRDDFMSDQSTSYWTWRLSISDPRSLFADIDTKFALLVQRSADAYFRNLVGRHLDLEAALGHPTWNEYDPIQPSTIEKQWPFWSHDTLEVNAEI